MLPPLELNIIKKVLDKEKIFCYNCNAYEIFAAMAQLVEHILGKDEVTSSTLVSSSRKTTSIERSLSFFSYIRLCGEFYCFAVDYHVVTLPMVA